MTMTTCADTSAPAEAEQISLYQAIGGQPAVTAAVDRLYARLLADPEVGPLFPRGVTDRHKAYVATFLGEALGGPRPYRGPDIPAVHRGLGISNAHFDLTATHLAATLDELGVPGDLADRVVRVLAGLRPAVVTL